MKVLYDSSVLISAFLKEASIHKTGIFRYVENLALGLQNQRGVSVHFYSSLDQKQHSLWQNKVFELAHLRQIPLINVQHPLKTQMQALSDPLKTAPLWKKLFLKGYRESLRFLLSRSTFEETRLKDFDLFYSPYHPVPKFIKEKKDFLSFSTIHDLIPLKYPKLFKVDKRPFFDRILKKTKPWHYFFALSESSKADISHYYSIPPSRIFVVHSAPTPGLFYPVREKALLGRIQAKYHIQKPYLLSVATLEPRKNILFLVEAFIKLISERPHLELSLVLVGAKGWGFETLLEKIKKYPEHIHFTGFVSDEDLAALYSGALSFVYPSLYEGFGLPPLEAMSCGTPVIVSDRSSLPEVVENAGLYIDPTRSDDLCAQILKVSEDAALREDLSQKSLLQAKKFSWEKNAEKAYGAFKSILSAR